MSINRNDINDDEIRIISSGNPRPDNKNRKPLIIVLCAVIVSLIIGIVLFLTTGISDAADSDTGFEQATPEAAPAVIPDSVPAAKAFAVKTDTVVGGVELSIITPCNATPVLEVGEKAMTDSSAVLMAQAADIRRDNGGIVGSYVLKGNLVSKGESKAGFCSIIGGEITVGVADATPMFEQALTSDGYFFRQYPLVVAGQVVENKPKGKSIRKALAEIDGKVSVIVSRGRLTFHDFSQALADAGVRNAIYLVCSSSYGRYTDSAGNVFTFGKKWNTVSDNVNFIVWR